MTLLQLLCLSLRGTVNWVLREGSATPLTSFEEFFFSAPAGICVVQMWRKEQ